MTLQDFIKKVPSFAAKSHAEKITLFGWFLHSQENKDRFSPTDIKKCYEKANLSNPSNIHSSVEALYGKSTKDILKDRLGFRLSQTTRDRIDSLYGFAETTFTIEKMLSDLPGKISDDGEKLFLTESLVCYRHGAFRASIVLIWNLSYDHVLRWILSDGKRLADFNAAIPKRNPKKSHVTINKREDFEELKEDEVVDIVGSMSGFTSGMKKVLKEKLGRRNTYAHPSTLQITRSQVDDMITDLINNVVLNLPVV